jgi:hypothetical protein
LWAEKEERIRKTSPFGRLPNWNLYSVIVKSGDDLRQEQLAVQLIETFYKIFKKAELPLYLYSYNVIATSSNSGLIETIPDAISIDALKKRIPNAKTLEDYFISVRYIISIISPVAGLWREKFYEILTGSKKLRGILGWVFARLLFTSDQR